MPIPSSNGAPLYPHDGSVVVLEGTSPPVPAADLDGGVYATAADAEAGVNRLPVYDRTGDAIAGLRTDSFGVVGPFATTVKRGWLAFGSAIESTYSVVALIEDYDELEARVAALEAGGGTGGGSGGTGGAGTFSGAFSNTF